MKLYWSKKGVVITSANLSTYALGSGGLKEIGVLLPASSINIDKVIKSLKAHVAKENEISDLEQAHKKVYRTNPNLAIKSYENYSFKKWYELKQHKKDGDWKLASFSTANVKLSLKAGQLLEKEHGNKSYEDLLETFTKEYIQDDWVLCYEFNGKRPIQIGWQYAHHVVKSPKKSKGKAKTCYQIIQVNKLKAYDKPPFEIDSGFKKAFAYAHKEYFKGDEDKMGDVIPSKDLLGLIYEKITKSNGD